MVCIKHLTVDQIILVIAIMLCHFSKNNLTFNNLTFFSLVLVTILLIPFNFLVMFKLAILGYSIFVLDVDLYYVYNGYIYIHNI